MAIGRVQCCAAKEMLSVLPQGGAAILLKFTAKQMMSTIFIFTSPSKSKNSFLGFFFLSFFLFLDY